MKSKCYVPHCPSNRKSVKLHRIPKGEIGLLWVKNIEKSVKNTRLKKLSPEELHKWFVCHKHFEKKYVTGSHRIRYSACPTLFSREEIDTGVPTIRDTSGYPDNLYIKTKLKCGHEDHTYATGDEEHLHTDQEVSTWIETKPLYSVMLNMVALEIG